MGNLKSSVPAWGDEAYQFGGTMPAIKKSYSIYPKPPVALASGTGGTDPGFTYQGGLVLNGPTVYNVFVGDWTSAADAARIPRLNQFMKDLLASSWMSIFKQYGCTNPSNFGGSFMIPDPNTNKQKEDDSVIETIIQNAVDSKVLPEPSSTNMIYCLYLDDNTGISDIPLGITMCAPAGNNSFGYHYHMVTKKGNDCFYSVIPSLNDQCLTNTCGANTCSLKAEQTQEQRQTQVISHEIAETITNPMGNGGWYNVSNGQEEGDLCNGDPVNLTVGPNSWMIQEIYSKVDGNKCVAAAGAGTSTVPLANIQAGALTVLTNKYNIAGGAILLAASIAFAVANKKGPGELIAFGIIGFSGGLLATELVKRYIPAAEKQQLAQIINNLSLTPTA